MFYFNMKKHRYHHKIFFTVVIIFILLILLASFNIGDDKKIIWGATFSKKQADQLGLNWQELYQKIIDEMQLKSLRIPIYWDEVEIRPGEYDFSNYVWMANRAAEKGIEVLPVLGRRVPRWPECHVPNFYKDYSETELQNKILLLIQQEINYFKNYQNIKKWQIDNEPFMDAFGECPPADKNFLEQEINLIKQMDERPIVITESGELSTWLRCAKLTKILGISMYRQTWNKNWGYFVYPLTPSYYYFKAQLIKLFTGVEKVINTELQVEPWSIRYNLNAVDLFDQFYAMDLSQVKSSINFAKRSGINEIYLWGVEWWYWLGQAHGHWEFWEYGKNLK